MHFTDIFVKRPVLAVVVVSMGASAVTVTDSASCPTSSMWS